MTYFREYVIIYILKILSGIPLAPNIPDRKEEKGKEKMNKRLISLLLVIVMIVTLLPMSVLAASNARTVKESKDVTPAESESSVAIGDPEGHYTVSIVNSSVSSNPDVSGKTKYLVKYGDLEKTFSLAEGETVTFKINEGDEYSVTYQGVSDRFKDSFKGMTMTSGDVEMNSVSKNWTHTMGQDLTNTVYYSSNEPDRIVEASDREVDGNGKVVKTETKKTYSIHADTTGSFYKTYTCTLTNVDDPTEIYTASKRSILDASNTAKREAVEKMKAAFSETYSQYSAYEKDEYYYIAEELSSKTETIQCPAEDVSLVFRSEMTPITGNMSINIYGPGISNMVEEDPLKDFSISFDLEKVLGDVGNALTKQFGNISEPTPKVVLKLTEVEGQEDYAGREYVLVENNDNSVGELVLGFLLNSETVPEALKEMLGDIDSTFISRQYKLPDDILKGEYLLSVESIDQAGVVLDDPSHREIPITISNGNTKVEPEEKDLLNISALNWLIKLIGNAANNENLNKLINLIIYKGLFLKESGSFAFTKVDAADQPLANAEFYMVNREETEKIIKFAFNLGKDNFIRVIKNMGDEEVFNWEEVVTLHTQLLKPDENNENNLTLNLEAVQKLIGTYIALITTVDGQKMDIENPETITENLATILNWDELRTLKIPAILKSVSDESGKVEWSKASNVTTTLFMDIAKDLIPRLTEALTQLGGDASDPATPADDLEETANSNTQMDMIRGILDLVLNDGLANGVVYNILWRLGIVTEKLPAGHYILFESKAPAGHLRNPMFYTVNVEWKDDDWVYASVADAGLLLPRIAENYYTYLRNTNPNETADKLIYNMLKPFVYNEENLEKCETIYSDIVTNKVDATAAMIKFASEELWFAYGDYDGFPYESEAALQEDMIKYLYNQGRTVQNLMVFANDIAKRNKGLITGEMNEDWHVYNYEASIFKTWQKSTKAIMDRLANSISDGNIKLTDENGIVTNYKDLNPARWYFTAVKWVLENGIMAGITTTDFRTTTPVSRGMAVTVLYAAAGKPGYTRPSKFSDVSESRYYFSAVSWAKENGIAEGIGNNEFAPDKKLSRQELVTMLKKYCEVMDMDINDVDTGAQTGLDQKVDYGTISGWAKTAMEWAFKVGAIFGLTEDTIDPLDIVNRAQLAQIIYKIMTYEKPADVPATDTPATDVPTGDVPSENTGAADAA